MKATTCKEYKGVQIRQSSRQMAADYLIYDVETAAQLARERAEERNARDFENLERAICGGAWPAPIEPVAPSMTYHSWVRDGVAYGGYYVD